MGIPFEPAIGSRWMCKRRHVFTVTGEPTWSPQLKVWFVHGTMQKLPALQPSGSRHREPRPIYLSVCHCDELERMVQLETLSKEAPDA